MRGTECGNPARSGVRGEELGNDSSYSAPLGDFSFGIDSFVSD